MFRFIRPSVLIPTTVALSASITLDRRQILRCDYSPVNVAGLPKSLNIKDAEFVLVASGTRKVTFLSISVYDIGIYIRSSDIGKLSTALHAVSEGTSTLQDRLARLKDSEHGAAFFNSLEDVSWAMQITPVRNTDIAHMRDGFVRGVLLRHNPDEQSLQSFKDFFPNPRKAFLKSDVMLLTLWSGKKLDLDINGHDYGSLQAHEPQFRDLLQAFFGTYTSGKKVASEPLREEFIQQIVQEAH